MPEMLEQLPPAMTCTQFAIGGDRYFVDKEFERLTKDGLHDVLQIPQVEMQEGDYVFYTNYAGIPVHVAVVNENGKLLSKFQKERNVVEHDVWEGIPDNYRYERYTVVRASSAK